MPFDATLKDLGRDYPNDLLTTFDQPPTGTVSLLNVDLSTITAAADLVLGIGEPLHEVVHVDFQSSASAWKHADILTYNALLHAEYHVPVHSIVILLRSKAAHANLSGTVSYTTRSGRGSMNFAYELVRLWERPADAFLKGGITVHRLETGLRFPGESVIFTVWPPRPITLCPSVPYAGT